jgi:hypothetical protein
MKRSAGRTEREQVISTVGHCAGKRTYFTFTVAKQMAGRTNKQLDGAHVQPYACPTCHRFHVGGRYSKHQRRDE